MKSFERVLSFLLAIIMLVPMLAATVSAEDEIVGTGKVGTDVTWTLNSAGVLELTGSGATYNYKQGESPFYNFVATRKIVISDGITYIGNYIFEDTGVKQVVFGADITEIGKAVFYECGYLTSVEMPDNITKIGTGAFSKCTSLTSVRLSDSLERIEDGVFSTCTALSSINLPKSLKYIGAGAFINCNKITELNLTEGIETIEKRAFVDCNLKSIVFPSSLKSIGYSVLQTNDNLTEAIFVGDFDLIDKTLFAYCEKLENAYFYGDSVTLGESIFEYSPSVTITCIEDSNVHKYAVERGYTCKFTEREQTVSTEGIYLYSNHAALIDTVSYARGVYSTGEELLSTQESVTISNAQIKKSVSEDIFSYALSDGTYSLLINFRDGTEKIYYLNMGSDCSHSYTTALYEADCQKDSYIETVCSKCGERTSADIEGTIQDHIFGEYTSNGDATCLSDGTRSAKCIWCDTIDTAADEGTLRPCYVKEWEYSGDATCLEDGSMYGYCIWCNKELINELPAVGTALGHSFTNYVFDENADCINDGTRTAKCDRCDATDTVIAEDSALGHSFVNYVSNGDVSCIKDGTETAKCERCYVTDTRIDEANGHIPDEWVVVEDSDYYREGYRMQSCTVCAAVLRIESIPVIEYDGFPDVWHNMWYAESAEYCFKHGYIMGTDKGTFAPDAKLTREQFVTILARISGAELNEYTESVFDDVNADAWYGSAVIWANTEGLVNGIGNGIFGVGEPLDREQLAVILYRYAQGKGIAPAEGLGVSYYEDAGSISAWALDACDWAIGNKLLGSIREGARILSPQMTVTRAQAAKIIMSFDALFERPSEAPILVRGKCGDELTWVFDGENAVLTITGSGKMYDYIRNTVPWIGFVSEIKRLELELGVTGIGDNAFAGCSSLAEVQLPDTLRFIGDSAFYGCGSLEAVMIPDSVENIARNCFSGCHGLESVKLGNGITTVDSNVFMGCESLTELTLGINITSIGDSAFNGCISLCDIDLPDSVILIGADAFSDTGYFCDEGNWEDGLLYLGKHLIASDPSRTGELIVIRDETLYIASGAFKDIYAEHIYIPYSVTHIFSEAFEHDAECKLVVCKGSYAHEYVEENEYSYRLIEIGICGDDLEWIYDSQTSTLSISGTGEMYDYSYTSTPWYGYTSEIKAVELNEGITSIGDETFCVCPLLDSITLPSTLERIGYYAFYKCEALTSVVIPDNVTTINGGAFQSCTGLESVVIGNGVEVIGVYAFEDCTALKDLTLGNSIRFIDDCAFYNCESLNVIDVPDSLKEIGMMSFNSTGYSNNKDNWEGDVLYLENHLLYTASGASIDRLDIKEGTKSIAAYAFENSYIEVFYVPASVEYISYGGFYNYYDYDEIYLIVVDGSYAEQYAYEHGIYYTFITL